MQTHARRRKVAIVLSSRPASGGAFQYSRVLLEGLAATQSCVYDVSVVCLNQEWLPIARTPFSDVVSLPPQRSILRRTRNALRFTSCGHRIWDVIRHRCSPLCAHLKSSGFDLAILPCDTHHISDSPVPTLVPIHDLMYLYERRFPEVGSWANFRRRLTADRLVCQRASGILVDSPLGSDHVRHCFSVPQNRVFVVPFVPRQGAACEAPSDLTTQPSGIPSRFIFYPAQFWLHKNHVGLLKAIALLKQEGLSVNLVLCGAEKNSGSVVRRAVAELRLGNNVHNYGFVDEMQLRWFYKNAVAMVMPTFFGPTNIPPLEAMLSGCPAAVSGVYAMEYQLGEAALYFNPNDAGDMARCIRALWSSEPLRRDLIRRGQARVSSLTVKAFGDKINAAVLKILNVRSAPPLTP